MHAEIRLTFGAARQEQGAKGEPVRRRLRRGREAYRPSDGDVGLDCSQCTYAGCQGPPAKAEQAGASSVTVGESISVTTSLPALGESCPFLRSINLPAFANANLTDDEPVAARRGIYPQRGGRGA